MGFYSSTQKTETQIPEQSPEEKALMQLATDGLMTAYLEEAGFEVTKETGPAFEMTDTYTNFVAQKESLQSSLDQLTTQLNDPTLSPTMRANIQETYYNRNAQISQQIAAIDKKIDEARGEYEPTIEYVTRQKSTAAVEQAREQYGADSQQYKDALAAEEQFQIDREASFRNLETMALEKTEAFLRGDFALNEGQKQFMDEMLGPMKDAALNAVNYIRDEAERSNTSIGDQITEFEKRVQQTGLSLGDAILEIENRVQTTGKTMNEALDEEIALSQKLVEMGLQDFTLEQRKSVAQQASALGRSPTDPNFQMELQDSVNREIERTGLQFGTYRAQQRMGIAERTGAGMEAAGQLRLGAAERTGGMMEQAAQQRISLAERTGSLREEAARLAGATGMGIAEAEAQLRQQMAMGMAPQQIGLGFDVSQFQSAMAQQRMANMASAMNAPLNLFQIQQRERMAQPTQTTTSTPSMGSIVGGIIGTGLQAGGMIASGGLSGLFSGSQAAATGVGSTYGASTGF